MSGTAMSSASSFFNMALPNQLSFLSATAGYDPSISAFTSGAWDYQPAMSANLLSSALAESEATNTAGLAAITNEGQYEVNLAGNYFNDWATAQNDFMTSVAQSLSTEASKSGSGGSGLFGQILGGLGALAGFLAI